MNKVVMNLLSRTFKHSDLTDYKTMVCGFWNTPVLIERVVICGLWLCASAHWFHESDYFLKW